MTRMRARAKVVGEVVVGAAGTEVTVDEAGVYVDDATETELAQAMTEADTEDGVSVEEAFSRLPPLTEELRRELREASESAKRGESVDMDSVLGEVAALR